MRITRQADAFAYRFAVDGSAYNDSAWDIKSGETDRILTDFFSRENGHVGPDGKRLRGVDTRRGMPQYATWDDVRGVPIYTPERLAQQQELVRDFLAGVRAGGKKATPYDQIPRQNKAILAGGLSGSGKTTILDDPRTGVNRHEYLGNNVDDLKELAAERGMVPSDEHYPELAGLSPMERTPLIHYEMQDLMDQIAARALKDGTNIIYDYTMAKPAAVERSLTDLKGHGYGVGGLFVEVGPEEALSRVLHRHRSGEEDYAQKKGSGGRPVPSYVSAAQKSTNPNFKSINAENFDKYAKTPGAFDQGWIMYDNSFDPNHVDMSLPVNQGPGGPKFSVPRILGTSEGGMFAPKAAARYANDEQYQIPELDPHSVRGLLEMYDQQYIDFNDLVGGIVQRYLNPTPKEEQDWPDAWLEAEGPADADSGIWIMHSVALGEITQEQADIIFAEIGRAVAAPQDSVGAVDALPGAGAAAPDAAPAPTLDKESSLWWI